MKVLVHSYRRFLAVLAATVMVLSVGIFSAKAQETDRSRELERVEIEAPERRAPARATTPPRTPGDYDQAPESEFQPSEQRRASSEVFSANGIPASTRSLVTDKSQVSIGAASLPAQVQVVNSEDIRQLNVRGDYANLFRTVAGVKAVNYGQGQIGTMVNMRGFKSSAGNEVAIFIDGVPQNYPSFTMNHGASEISWLSAEIVDKIEIIKGPFSSLYGDFALGGVVNIVTKKSDPAPSVSAEGGSFGNFRAFGIFSSDNWVPTPFFSQDYYTTDGYRDNAQLNQWSPFNKVSFPLWGGILSLRYNYFQSEWGAPGYWPIDWVKSGAVKRTDAYNPSDGGRNKTYELVMNYAPPCGERGLYATLYVADFHHLRYAKFLPATGSQFGRQDDRNFWGGRVFYNMVFGDLASLTIGGETRQDSGETQQYYTVDRRRTTTRYDYEMRLSNWAAFIEAQVKPVESVKIVGAVRWDWFSQQFDNLVLPENSGKGNPYIRSPKIGFVFTPVSNFNIFGNIGCGFRSPSYLEVSPYSAGTSTGYNLEPAMVQTYDIGCNATVFGNLYLAADYYHTNMQREIRTVNSNPVIIGDTVREGYELEARYFASDHVSFFGSYAWVDATVTDPSTPGQVLLTDISEHSIKAGVSLQKDFGLYGSVLTDLYYEYFSGPPNYSGSRLIWGPDFDVYNFKLTYSGRGWSSFFTARCKPREYSNDTTWVNTGLLVYDPLPQWDLSGGLSYTFW